LPTSGFLHESGFLLGLAVTAVLEIISALGFGEEVEDWAAELPELVDRAGCAIAESFFEFGKRQRKGGRSGEYGGK